MFIQFFTEPGGKVINEDFLIARRHPASDFGYICVLADGQGGRANGALAAKTACESVWRLASVIPMDLLLRSETWDKILRQVDAEVSLTDGFTTLVALAVTRESAAGASSGDSKAYYSPVTTLQVTEWTHAQLKNPPVGSGDAEFTTFSYRGIRDSRLLVLSDGAWKFCGYDALKAAFTIPIQTLRDHFHSAILLRGGSSLPDDLSIIAIDIP